MRKGPVNEKPESDMTKDEVILRRMSKLGGEPSMIGSMPFRI